FRVEGFTTAVALSDLRALTEAKGVPLVADLGSGLLVPDPLLPDEPHAAPALSDGADVVTASGDKLLGGPQAGLILGKREAIRKIQRHPLARVVRIDKLSLAALEATLRLYANGEENEIPTLRYLARPVDEVRRFAL